MEAADQFPARRIALRSTPQAKAADVAIALVEPGASILVETAAGTEEKVMGDPKTSSILKEVFHGRHRTLFRGDHETNHKGGDMKLTLSVFPKRVGTNFADDPLISMWVTSLVRPTATAALVPQLREEKQSS